MAVCIAAATRCGGKNLPTRRTPYLDNGQLRIGVNLAIGGAITGSANFSGNG